MGASQKNLLAGSCWLLCSKRLSASLLPLHKIWLRWKLSPAASALPRVFLCVFSGEACVAQTSCTWECAPLPDNTANLSSPCLFFQVPPNDPEIQNGPIVHVISNIPYNLSCRAAGAKPAAEISWYRDGQRQESAVYSKVRLC